MRENPYPGLFIAVEGMDRSGKRTQARRIYEYLANRTLSVVYTKEPWWGRMSESDHRLRRIITKQEAAPQGGIQDFFIDNRERHLVWEIIPYLGLRAPTAVVSERYAFSTFAYGPATSSVTYEELYEKHEHMQWFIFPDLTIILDIPETTALTRLGTTAHEIFEESKILERVRGNYLTLANLFKNDRTVLIDGTKAEDEIFALVQPHVDNAIREKYGEAQL